jgi:valyl-tRNA synthetase
MQWRPNVNRWIGVVCGIVLLISPHTLLAQRRGGRGPANSPNGAPNNDDLKDFNRALALQVTADQKTQFQGLTKSTQAARKGTQDFLHVAESASKVDLLHLSEPLSDTVEEAQANSEKFLRSFSAAQKSGLKAVTKKLGKANAEITKQSKALNQRLGQSKFDSKQIAGIAEKLDKALGDFQTEHGTLGTEMGIQGEGGSKSGSK